MSKEKIAQLQASFSEKTPKQMRTIRNSLNNRIKSFEDELEFGRTLPKLSLGHKFYDCDLKELKGLLILAKRKIKAQDQE